MRVCRATAVSLATLLAAVAISSCSHRSHVVREVHREAKAANIRGNELFYRGDLVAAAREYDRGRLLARGVDDREIVAESLNNMGLLSLVAGDFTAAGEKFEEALGLNRQIGNRKGEAANLLNRGDLFVSTGDFTSAEVDYETAREIYRSLVDRHGEALAQNGLGLAAFESGDAERGRRLVSAALASALELKRHRLAAACFLNLGRIDEAEGRLEGALALYRRALSEDKLVENAKGIGQDLRRIGGALASLGRFAEAKDNLERALAVHTQLGFRKGMISDLGLLADVASRTGDAVAEADCRNRISELEREPADKKVSKKKRARGQPPRP